MALQFVQFVEPLEAIRAFPFFNHCLKPLIGTVFLHHRRHAVLWPHLNLREVLLILLVLRQSVSLTRNLTVTTIPVVSWFDVTVCAQHLRVLEGLSQLPIA
jgi:hypothetical protein